MHVCPHLAGDVLTSKVYDLEYYKSVTIEAVVSDAELLSLLVQPPPPYVDVFLY